MFWNKQHQAPEPTPLAALDSLPHVFRAALLSMYLDEPQLGSDGQRHQLDGKTLVIREQGMWLYQLCRDTKPRATLEIGLAYGFSALFFLAAIHENGTGRHTAIDPYQDYWHGIGKRHPATVGMGDRFRLIEEKSATALAHLCANSEMFDLIFIDGDHRFDNALTDFALSATVCPVGGCIVLDDMWMPAIRRVVAFIRTNRKDFEEIATPVSNVALFRRVSLDQREWQHFVEF